VSRLSVEYIGPKSRTERPRKTKIGTEVAHVTQGAGHIVAASRTACYYLRLPAATAIRTIRDNDDDDDNNKKLSYR